MDVGAPTVLMGWPFFGTTQVSQYQKGKTNLDFTEAGAVSYTHLTLPTILRV